VEAGALIATRREREGKCTFASYCFVSVVDEKHAAKLEIFYVAKSDMHSRWKSFQGRIC
jgi:hypothetical protein